MYCYNFTNQFNDKYEPQRLSPAILSNESWRVMLFERNWQIDTEKKVVYIKILRRLRSDGNHSKVQLSKRTTSIGTFKSKSGDKENRQEEVEEIMD